MGFVWSGAAMHSSSSPSYPYPGVGEGVSSCASVSCIAPHLWRQIGTGGVDDLYPSHAVWRKSVNPFMEIPAGLRIHIFAFPPHTACSMTLAGTHPGSRVYQLGLDRKITLQSSTMRETPHHLFHTVHIHTR